MILGPTTGEMAALLLGTGSLRRCHFTPRLFFSRNDREGEKERTPTSFPSLQGTKQKPSAWERPWFGRALSHLIPTSHLIVEYAGVFPGHVVTVTIVCKAHVHVSSCKVTRVKEKAGRDQS